MRLSSKPTQVLFFILSLSILSCKKEEPKPLPASYKVPTTYNFENAEVNGMEAATRQKMMVVLIEETEKGNKVGTRISNNILNDMFTNNQATSPFKEEGISTLLSIKEATSPTFLDKFEPLAKRLEIASQAADSGASNKSGVMKSISNSVKLYDAKGYAPYELIEKGLMGAMQYYQITSILLKDNKIGASIIKIERQKNWDLAFAYLGLPIDYPAIDKTPFWGEYLGTIGPLLNNNDKTIFNAFIKGRAAIDNDDHTVVAESAATIIKELERSAAGLGLKYLLRAKTYYTSDPVRKNAGLTEGYGFIEGLRYSDSKTISEVEINELESLIGDNNWSTSLDNINIAIAKLSLKFGFDTSNSNWTK